MWQTALLPAEGQPTGALATLDGRFERRSSATKNRRPSHDATNGASGLTRRYYRSKNATRSKGHRYERSKDERRVLRQVVELMDLSEQNDRGRSRSLDPAPAPPATLPPGVFLVVFRTEVFYPPYSSPAVLIARIGVEFGRFLFVLECFSFRGCIIWLFEQPGVGDEEWKLVRCLAGGNSEGADLQLRGVLIYPNR